MSTPILSRNAAPATIITMVTMPRMKLSTRSRLVSKFLVPSGYEFIGLLAEGLSSASVIVSLDVSLCYRPCGYPYRLLFLCTILLTLWNRCSSPRRNRCSSWAEQVFLPPHRKNHPFGWSFVSQQAKASFVDIATNVLILSCWRWSVLPCAGWELLIPVYSRVLHHVSHGFLLRFWIHQFCLW